MKICKAWLQCYCGTYRVVYQRLSIYLPICNTHSVHFGWNINALFTPGDEVHENESVSQNKLRIYKA